MKYYLIVAIIALTGLAAKAQTRFRTDESVRSQLINGTAPGLLFSKSAQKQQASAPVPPAIPGRQIRNNAVPGMKYKEQTAPAQPGTEPNVQTRPDTASADSRAGINRRLPEKAALPTAAD